VNKIRARLFAAKINAESKHTKEQTQHKENNTVQSVIKFSRNGVRPPVSGVPPPEIAVLPPKVVVPPPGNDVPSPFWGKSLKLLPSEVRF